MSVIAAGLLAAAGPAGAQSSPACENADAQPQTVTSEAFSSSMLCLINVERTSRGLKALRTDPKLGSAAAGHSTSMRLGGYFGHDDPSGAGFASRIQATGYTKKARRWLIGENIGWGAYAQGTPRSLMAAWMQSAEHRTNILERNFREIGVGVEWGSPADPKATGAMIVTTDFGFVKHQKRHP